MNTKRSLLLVGLCVLVLSLAFAGQAFTADQVTVKGKMDNGGKHLTTEDGQMYTVLASSDMQKDMNKLTGKTVEMTGVIKVNKDRKIFSVSNYKVLN
jgi:hypothetical protein